MFIQLVFNVSSNIVKIQQQNTTQTGNKKVRLTKQKYILMKK